MMKIQNYQLLVQLNINFICMKLGNWNEGEICQSFRGFAQIHKNFTFLRFCIDAIINCFYPSEKLHKYIIQSYILSLGPSWSWSYGSWIYNYLCNQYLSPPKLWVRTPFITIIIMWSSLSVTCDKSVVFSGYSDFLQR